MVFWLGMMPLVQWVVVPAMMIDVVDFLAMQNSKLRREAKSNEEISDSS